MNNWKRIDARDVLLVSGLAAVIYGVHLWSVPAAWVVGGTLQLGFWLRPHLRKVPK